MEQLNSAAHLVIRIFVWINDKYEHCCLSMTIKMVIHFLTMKYFSISYSCQRCPVNLDEESFFDT